MQGSFLIGHASLPWWKDNQAEDDRQFLSPVECVKKSAVNF